MHADAAFLSHACTAQVSFAWNGFTNAMISNLGMVLRNIYSKKSLVNYKHVDGINLFGLISIASLVYCAPAAVVMEGHMWGECVCHGVMCCGVTWFADAWCVRTRRVSVLAAAWRPAQVLHGTQRHCAQDVRCACGRVL